MAETQSRERVRNFYKGWDIDIDCAEDHEVSLDGPAKDSPVMDGKDTEVKLLPKPPNINDPYNN